MKNVKKLFECYKFLLLIFDQYHFLINVNPMARLKSATTRRLKNAALSNSSHFPPALKVTSKGVKSALK